MHHILIKHPRQSGTR